MSRRAKKGRAARRRSAYNQFKMIGGNSDPRSPRGWGIIVGLLAALMVVMLPSTKALAEGQARIQQVEAEDGRITMLFAASGLPQGQYLDPNTTTVSVGGQDVPASATRFTNNDEDPLARQSVLAIDTSGSMKDGRLASAKAAADQYLRSVPADMAIGLVTFADKATVVVKPTTDRAAVTAAVSGLKPAGDTALYDGTVAAVSLLGDSGSRNVLLLSDGADDGSATTAAEARAAVKESGVVVDSVSLGSGTQVAELEALATAGGGQLVRADSAADLTAAFEQAAATSKSQIVVTAELPEGTPTGTQNVTVSATAGDEVYSTSVATSIPEPTVSNAPIQTQVTGSSFLGSPITLILVLTVLFGALFVIAWIALQRATGKTPANELKHRLNAYTVEDHKSDSHEKQSLRDRDLTRQAVHLADEAMEGKEVKRTIQERLEAAAISVSTGEWAVLSLGIGLAAAVVVGFITGLSVLWMLIAGALGVMVPWIILGSKAAKRQKAFYEGLPDTLQLISGSLKAGYSFRQAVDSVAQDSTGPIAEEFNRAVNESRVGVPLEDALDAVAHRMKSQDLSWTVMAVRINQRIGGNLTEVLETVAKTVRERERLRRQVRTLTAEGKLSAYVLLGLPIAMLAYLILLRPEYVEAMFGHAIGIMMLAAAAVLMFFGWLWMNKLTRMEV